MTLPAKEDLLTMDYAFQGLPFVWVKGKSSISLAGMDYASNGLPFVSAFSEVSIYEETLDVTITSVVEVVGVQTYKEIVDLTIIADITLVPPELAEETVDVTIISVVEVGLSAYVEEVLDVIGQVDVSLSEYGFAVDVLITSYVEVVLVSQILDLTIVSVVDVVDVYNYTETLDVTCVCLVEVYYEHTSTAPNGTDIYVCGFYRHGISREQPWFSAYYYNTGSLGATKFQTYVASTDSSSPIWMSPIQSISIVNSFRSPDILYTPSNSPYLTFGGTYYVRVRFWDTEDKVGAWSTAEPMGMKSPSDAVLTWKASAFRLGWGKESYGMFELGYGGGDLDGELKDTKIEVWVDGSVANTYYVDKSEYSLTKMATWTYNQSMNINDNGRFRSALGFHLMQRGIDGSLSEGIWAFCNTP